MVDEQVASKHDGRGARRERNRIAVLDAVIELFESGNVDPGVDEVSERSGVSTRSVYRYFNHRDELIRAALWHLNAKTAAELELRDVGVGDLDDRIIRFVRHRTGLHAALASVMRAARRASTPADLEGEQHDANRLRLHEQFIDHFADRFGGLDVDHQVRIEAMAELPFQFDSLEYIHSILDGDPAEIESLLVDHLRMLFGEIRA
jgi:AcrR family transcriptional regulator